MHFFARLNPKGSIHRDWRAHSRISGLVSEVLFRWDPAKHEYLSEELPPGVIDLFRVRADNAVILETLRVLPEPQQVDEPVRQQQDAVTEPQQVPQQLAVDPEAKAKPRTVKRRRLAE